jgi:hypothetical protein
MLTAAVDSATVGLRKLREETEMPDKKLVLHPTNPWAILQDPPLLLEQLRAFGLIGSSFPHLGDLHYHSGPRFAELVHFHTAKESVAAAVKACHVALMETAPEPSFLAGSNTRPPACPRCQAKFTHWSKDLLAWQADKRHYRWTCPGCARSLPVEALDWDRTAGVARYALDIWGIGEGEAEPATELLEFLEAEMAEPWLYFYYVF